ncbi:hypothetical protein [Kineococcus sp. SYSU DK002]|uniref:hypothetical protein n=1 Tax=Kineococcus sp. SYSU DK002 TaxID=3383123 RepID=UPI003D7EB9E3
MGETRLLTFELNEASSEHVLHDGNVTRRPRSFFLDWVVDGASLREQLVGADSLVTPLNRPWLPHVSESVDALTGRTPGIDLAPGRVGILLCVVCGDVEVSAALELHTTTVVWSDLHWEGAEPDFPVEGAPAVLTFERAGYEEALEEAYERVARLPYEASEHTTRRFLWPWQWGWRLPRS